MNNGKGHLKEEFLNVISLRKKKKLVPLSCNGVSA